MLSIRFFLQLSCEGWVTACNFLIARKLKVNPFTSDCTIIADSCGHPVPSKMLLPGVARQNRLAPDLTESMDAQWLFYGLCACCVVIYWYAVIRTVSVPVPTLLYVHNPVAYDSHVLLSINGRQK